MKLNPNCIRDILLYIESETDFFKSINFKSSEYEKDFGYKYSKNEIIYHLKQCIDFNYIVASNMCIRGSVIVKDLTPVGHEFLEKIRDKTVWEKTKIVFNKAPIKTIESLADIAKAVVTTEISKFITSQSL